MDHLNLIQQQFGRQAEAYERMAGVNDPKMHRATVAATAVGPSDRVVDFACGPGFLTMTFAEVVREVVGVDTTDTFLAHARAEAQRRGLRNISFVRGDVEQPDLPDDAFNLASCRAAFHHFPNPARVVAQMKRVVRPGGRLVILDMLSSEDPAKADYHNRIETLCDPSHARALPASEFERMFADQGLKIVRKDTREISYSLPQWLSHGGPSPENVAQIRSMMEESLAVDRCGLRVRREGGELHFSHTGVSYLLQKPAS